MDDSVISNTRKKSQYTHVERKVYTIGMTAYESQVYVGYLLTGAVSGIVLLFTWNSKNKFLSIVKNISGFVALLVVSVFLSLLLGKTLDFLFPGSYHEIDPRGCDPDPLFGGCP